MTNVGNMLDKDPKNCNNEFTPKIYLDSARKAFQVILNAMELTKNKKLLLPAYIGITDREGSGVMDPVEETNTPYEFYDLNLNLGAVEGELYSKIESGGYGAVLVIHYFGFCQNNMERLVSLCKKNKVVLIEDCAHAMHSFTQYGRLGSFGTFSFTSLHKFLPVEDGGCLHINDSSHLSLIHQTVGKKPLPETLETVARSDFSAIGKRRRDNYLNMLGLFKEISELQLMYPILPEGISPHNFPVLIPNNRREPIYFKLIERKVPVIALYYRMIEPIKEKNYKTAKYLSNAILNFPIHQDISKEDVEFMARETKSVLKDGITKPLVVYLK